MKPEYMELALKEAMKAYKEDEVPVGAVLVCDDKVIAKAHNKKEKKKNPLCHAEIETIKKGIKRLDSKYLDNCDLYVTLEPCAMCAGAIIQARIRNVYYGAYDPKSGSVESVIRIFDEKKFNHHPLYKGGIMKDECAKILQDYFSNKRQK